MRFGNGNLARRNLVPFAKYGTGNIVPTPYREPRNNSEFVGFVEQNPYYLPPDASALTLLQLYKTSPWVRTIVGKIGKAVARQNWYLEDDNGTRITKHPALNFIKSGSAKLPWRASIATTIMHVDLAGESYWALGRDNKGTPSSYAPMPAHWVISVPNATQDYYIIRPRMGITFNVPKADILAFIDTDPANPYSRGASLTGAASVELSTDASASNFLDGFFKNRARPDLIVSGTEGAPLEPESAARLEMTWIEKFRGMLKQHRPFFSALPLNIQEVGSGLRDNEVTDVRKDLRDVVSQIYGIPPEILGRIDSSNRATIDAADYLFAAHTLSPRLEMLGDVLEVFLEDEFNLSARGLSLKFDTPVKEDVKTRLSVMQAQEQAFTPNEFRVAAGLKPLDLEGFDDPIEAPQPPVMFGLKPDTGEDDKPDGDPPDDAGDDGAPAGSKAALAEIVKAAVTSALADQASAEASKPAEAVTAAPTANEAIAELVQTLKDAVAPKPLPVAVDPAPVVVAKTLTPGDIVSVSDAIDDPSVVAEASKLMEQIMNRLLDTYGAELLEQLESDVDFQVNGEVAQWLIDKASSLIGDVNDTTQAALAKSLVEGASNSEDVDALMQRVDDLFAAAAETRVTMIGDTVATALTGFASLSAGKQANLSEKTWITSHDQIVRQSHAAMDGQVRSMDGLFRSPRGGEAQFPGDFGEAAEDINCRCAMRPLLPGEKAAPRHLTKEAKSKYIKWHADAYEVVSYDVSRGIAQVFKGQAAVVKHKLKLAFAGR